MMTAKWSGVVVAAIVVVAVADDVDIHNVAVSMETLTAKFKVWYMDLYN